MQEEQLRKLIALSQPVLEWVKVEMEGDDLTDTTIYKNSIQSLIIIEQMKEELLKQCSRSSNKFRQTRINFK